MLANEYQAIIWALGRATLLGRGTPDNWAFEDPSRHNWAPQWAIWNSTGGKEGIEPPQEVKDQIALWTRFKQVPSDSPEAVELGRKYFGWFADNLWFIPTVGLSPQPIIVHNRLRNVPTEGLTWSSDHNFYAPFHMEQFYIEE
jgi:peptide/nickel transport system substrate-binding protein